MHGENLLVNDGSNWQAIEAVGKSLPQFDVVTSLALVVETVDPVDGGTFVVAAENEEVLRVFDLVCQQQADCLERLLAPIHVVAEEEVVGLWWEASVLEETQEVVVLPVNVTADLASELVNVVAISVSSHKPLSALPARAELAGR